MPKPSGWTMKLRRKSKSSKQWFIQAWHVAAVGSTNEITANTLESRMTEKGRKATARM